MNTIQEQIGADATTTKTLPYWLDPKFYVGNFIAIGIAIYIGYYFGKKAKK